MSFFGAQPTASAGVKKVSTLSVQTSAYGVTIPRAWGTTRIAGNLIWYGDFVAQELEGQGGKGGGSYVAGYSYSTSLQVALCDNAVTAIPTSWASKYKGPLPEYASFSTGGLSQSPWAYMTANHPADAMGYPGVVWVGYSNAILGSTPTLPNLSFEVVTASAGIAGTPDAGPWQVVTDVLQDVGYPYARIGDLTSYTTFCMAYGLLLSPLMDQQQRAGDHVGEILDMTCSAPFWSEGVLKVVPFGDTAKTANGYTYTPNIAPVYGLTDDDFLPVDGETMPIRISRKAPADQKNTLRIEFKDREQDYASSPVEAQDDAHIAQYGRRPGSTKNYDAIKTAGVATTVAWLQLQRGLYVLNTYEFRLGWRYCRLEPMDIVTLTHAGLGMSAVPVRILDVEDAPGGVMTITAEDFAQGAGLAPTVSPPPKTGYSINTNVSPGNVVTPVVFEPPILLAGQPEIWLAASGGANYGGCVVWVSTDGATYQRVGTMTGKARYGTASLALGADPDSTNTLAVDLTISGGTLAGGTADDRDLYHTLCVIGAELVSFRDATLTAPNKYNLGSLRRGAYGSPITAHAAGSAFVRLDDQVFRYPYDPAMVGKTIYIKLQAYNIYGAAYQDLATLTPITRVISGYPPPAVAGYAGSVASDGTRVHTWAASANVPAGTVCEIRYSASSGTAWAGMALLGQAPYGAGRLEVQTPAAGTWTFEARLRDSFGVVSATGSRATVAMGAVGPIWGQNIQGQPSDSAILNSQAIIRPNLQRGMRAWTHYGTNWTYTDSPNTADKSTLVILADQVWVSSNGPAMSLAAGTYTISFRAFCSVARELHVDLWPDTLPESSVVLTPGWNLYSFVWTSSHPDLANCFMRFFAGPSGSQIEIGDVKLEVGNQRSAWSQHPLDNTDTSARAAAAAAATTAQWTGVTGAGKPADNATVGATFGVDINGQITGANAATYIANKALGTPQLGSNSATGVYSVLDRFSSAFTSLSSSSLFTTTDVIDIEALADPAVVEVSYSGIFGCADAAASLEINIKYYQNTAATGWSWVQLFPSPMLLASQEATPWPGGGMREIPFSYTGSLVMPAGAHPSILVDLRMTSAGSTGRLRNTTFKAVVVKK